MNKYSTYSLLPAMTWLDNVSPNAPLNFTAQNDNSGIKLTWTKPSTASDSDTAKRFVIYKSTSSPVDISKADNILTVTNNDTTEFIDENADYNTTYYYKITALDKLWNESTTADEISFNKSSRTSIADFEINTGVFNKAPTYSGSTVGISTSSSSVRTTETAYNSSGSLKLTLIDNSSSSSNWTVRLLSGTGSPANNQNLQSNGYFGFWLKTSTAPTGAQTAITVDDAAGGTELSSKKDIINDGQWNLYEWQLPGSGWSSFAGGNGLLDGSTFTLDAIMFYASNNSPDWILYIDDVTHDIVSPLPVELTSFTAVAGNAGVELNWSTATEVNNYGFEIERCVGQASACQWENIGFVQGHGNSNSPKDYTFTDTDVKSGTYEYRLKQIDFNGTFSYSETVSVNIGGSLDKLSMDVYPNPFNPSTTIAFVLPKASHVNLYIYDITGQKVAELIDNEFMESGYHKLSFNAGQLASGIYISVIHAEGMQVVKKLQLLK